MCIWRGFYDSNLKKFVIRIFNIYCTKLNGPIYSSNVSNGSIRFHEWRFRATVRRIMMLDGKSVTATRGPRSLNQHASNSPIKENLCPEREEKRRATRWYTVDADFQMEFHRLTCFHLFEYSIEGKRSGVWWIAPLVPKERFFFFYVTYSFSYWNGGAFV